MSNALAEAVSVLAAQRSRCPDIGTTLRTAAAEEHE